MICGWTAWQPASTRRGREAVAGESGDCTEETIAFGDQLNDIEMLGRAYYSFAIGNARPEVKEAARFEADTNVRDGVLKILKLLV